MRDKITQGNLYDFYGQLLNDHQRDIYELFVLEDLSLAEIAEEKEISRQAVHDVIKRATKTLEEYEAKLQLIAKFHRIKDKVRDIDEIAKLDAKDDILRLTQEILEEL